MSGLSKKRKYEMDQGASSIKKYIENPTIKIGNMKNKIFV